MFEFQYGLALDDIVLALLLAASKDDRFQCFQFHWYFGTAAYRFRPLPVRPSITRAIPRLHQTLQTVHLLVETLDESFLFAYVHNKIRLMGEMMQELKRFVFEHQNEWDMNVVVAVAGHREDGTFRSFQRGVMVDDDAAHRSSVFQLTCLLDEHAVTTADNADARMEIVR